MIKWIFVLYCILMFIQDLSVLQKEHAYLLLAKLQNLLVTF